VFHELGYLFEFVIVLEEYLFQFVVSIVVVDVLLLVGYDFEWFVVFFVEVCYVFGGGGFVF